MNKLLHSDAFSINNARIVTPAGIVEDGSLRIESEWIIDISRSGKNWYGDDAFDANGLLLLPGFVDVHADSLEAAISPRPSTPFFPEAVLPSYDAELAMHGITTVFHCVGLADLGDLAKPLRKREVASKIVDAIRQFSEQSLLRTCIHLRYEITDIDSMVLLGDMIAKESIDLLSIMDHTPGFGVFKDLEAYRDYYRRSGQSAAEADEKYTELMARRKIVDEESLQNLIGTAIGRGLTVVSHDDNTPEKLAWAKSLGVSIAEFPVTLEAVDYARENDMSTVFGTPNLIRGMSHAGNLLVSDMLLTDRMDILCLDYSPRCSLPALFKAAHLTRKPLSEISQLFSLNPARSVGLGEKTGSIEPGKAADLILVSDHQAAPRVIATFVGGQPVYQTIAEPSRLSEGLLRDGRRGRERLN